MASLSSYYPQPLPIGTTSESVVVATGSSASRSLGDRFGEVFHVEDYGAVGDWNGTTGTDDTAAIQAAINAAVAAGGGIVRFGANKKYRLNTRSSASADWGGTKNTHFLRVGSGSNSSGFGSTSMRLLFDGQNATLHATNFVDGQTNDIIYTFCRFQEICFRDFKFSRNDWITSSNGPLANAIAFTQFDTNYSDLVRVENCYFYNHLHSIYFDPSFSTHVAWEDVRGKLKRLEVVGCVFEHPNGDSRVLGFGGEPQGVATGWGALVDFNSPWIDTAVYDRCYADGCANSTVPAGYHEPMHGFLFPMPIKCQITNCYFKNFYVELIKASDNENFNAKGISVNGGFTQVAVGNPITLTISDSAQANQKLVINRIYCLHDPSVYQGRRGGYFKLEAKTGGGSYTFAAGEQLNFTRVDGTPYQLSSSLTINTGQTFGNNNIGLIDMEFAEQFLLQVSGCIFEGQPIKRSDGTPLSSVSGNVSWYAPAILCDYHCVVDSNVFIGGSSDLYTDTSACSHHATIFTNNIVKKFNPQNVQILNQSVFLRSSNCLVANNYFTYRESKDTRAFMFVSGDEIIIKDNVCVVLNPSSVGSNGVTTGPFFIQYGGGGPYRVFSENNYLQGLEHYGNSGDAGYVASYIGSLRGSFAAIAYPAVSGYENASQPIRLATTHKSPDGSTWTIGLTNDGELEVIK